MIFLSITLINKCNFKIPRSWNFSSNSNIDTSVKELTHRCNRYIIIMITLRDMHQLLFLLLFCHWDHVHFLRLIKKVINNLV